MREKKIGLIEEANCADWDWARTGRRSVRGRRSLVEWTCEVHLAPGVMTPSSVGLVFYVVGAGRLELRTPAL